MAKKRKRIKKEIRDKLLVDAMHRCCLCPQHENITDIHHIVLISEDGLNTEENLMVVCLTCHAKIHRIRTMYNVEQLKMYKEKWVNLCAMGLTLEERLKGAPEIKLDVGTSLHKQMTQTDQTGVHMDVKKLWGIGGFVLLAFVIVIGAITCASRFGGGFWNFMAAVVASFIVLTVLAIVGRFMDVFGEGTVTRFLDTALAALHVGITKGGDGRELSTTKGYEVERETYKPDRDIDVKQLVEKEKERGELDFPFGPSLHNQAPPEENFVGRKDMLETITQWYKNPDVRIGALIGWGGVGKSALVRKWYDELEANNIQPDGIFWWGFYRNAFIEQFLDELLKYVSDGQIEPEAIKSTWEKTDRIKEYIGRGAYLIILDGLEQMQEGKSGDEFGKMIHRECTELLYYLADAPKANGLCLITSRYPLTDIKNYEGTVYQGKAVESLSIKDGRKLFYKLGVKGNQEEIDSVINEYDGHALSLTLLSKYLVEDFGGDIKKAEEIPAFYSDKEAGGKAHRILLWYAKQLNEEQSAFMKIFSLFRRAVREEDFEGVFRAKMETEMNQALTAMSKFAFKRMVDNLVDRRLISKAPDDTYATHPLIKNYFESIFDEEDKKLCHKRIYEYIGEYAPERPETLEEMQPLFEQVYHGCAAGLYDEVDNDVYWEKITRGEEFFIQHKLGAWETDLSLTRTFFPQGDFSQMPLVTKKSNQGWLLAVAGLALKNIGRPKEAEEPFLTAIKLYTEDKDWENASMGYQNLADLQFRTGGLESGINSAQKALEMAEKAKNDVNILQSQVYLCWILYLLGKTKEAEEQFRQADGLSTKTCGCRLSSGWGVFYADFLISMERIDEAFELIKQNLEICQRNNWIWVFSMCHRCLGSVERIKGNYKEAEGNLQKALEIARKVGMPFLEIEALIETGRLAVDMGRHKDAVRDANEVLKICERTGFRLHEPGAEIVLARAYLGLKDFEKAETFAQSAYEKAVGMKYRWAEGDAADLLGEIYSAMADKAKARKWLKKAVVCRKKILDPKVKESETILAGLR